MTVKLRFTQITWLNSYNMIIVMLNVSELTFKQIFKENVLETRIIHNCCIEKLFKFDLTSK